MDHLSSSPFNLSDEDIEAEEVLADLGCQVDKPQLMSLADQQALEQEVSQLQREIVDGDSDFFTILARFKASQSNLDAANASLSSARQDLALRQGIFDESVAILEKKISQLSNRVDVYREMWADVFNKKNDLKLRLDETVSVISQLQEENTSLKRTIENLEKLKDQDMEFVEDLSSEDVINLDPVAPRHKKRRVLKSRMVRENEHGLSFPVRNKRAPPVGLENEKDTFLFLWKHG